MECGSKKGAEGPREVDPWALFSPTRVTLEIRIARAGCWALQIDAPPATAVIAEQHVGEDQILPRPHERDPAPRSARVP